MDMIVGGLFTLLITFTFTDGNRDQKLSEGLLLFSGLDNVLGYFRNNTDELAQKILFTFETECLYMTTPVLPDADDPSRKPFIVIEGNHRPSRDHLGMRLSRRMRGRYLNNPAPCLVKYLQQVPAASFLRRAYYALSLYATDFNVRVHISTGRAVVLNGCWLDQMTFSLIQTHKKELPEMTSHVYQWPTDLLLPDLICYLRPFRGPRTGRATVLQSPADMWQNRSEELYQSLQSRYPILMLEPKIKVENLYREVVHHVGNKRDVQIEVPEESEKQNALDFFKGLENVLGFFRNHSTSLAQRILQTFENDCYFKVTPNIPTDKNRKPFIVIEGNGQSSRDTVGKGLARKMNARYMIHPASCLVKYMDILPKGTLLKRAFYVLSLYAMSFNVRAHLSTNRAVVLNGYYLDQLTFTMAQSRNNETVTADMFRLPEELLQPDLVFYLHLQDESRTIQQGTSKLNTRTLDIYKSLQSTYPIVVETLRGDDITTTDDIFKVIKERLGDTRHIVLQEYDEVSQVLRLFSGLQEVLNFFRNSTNPLAKEILTAFETNCLSELGPPSASRKPFIVIEGNNRTSRDVVVNRLARIMNGLSIKHPAPCLKDFLENLPRGTLLRRAYYILSLYATSRDAQRLVSNSPVFLNGYWLDQLTFAMIQCYPYGRLPPVTSPVFAWPQHLLQPDLIVYVNHPDNLYRPSPMTRSHRNWKPRALELYRNLRQIYNIQVQDVKNDYWQTTDEIYQHINQNLYSS